MILSWGGWFFNMHSHHKKHYLRIIEQLKSETKKLTNGEQ